MEFLNAINGWVWGPVTLTLIAFTGVYLMIGLRFMPLRRLVLRCRRCSIPFAAPTAKAM